MHIPNLNVHKIGHLIIFLVVGGIMVVNGVLLYGASQKAQAEKTAVEEAGRPAELEFVAITAPGCTQCFDLNTLIAPLKGNDQIKVVKEQTLEYTADEAVALIQKYGITRVPTLIVGGNVEKAFDVASFIQNLGRKTEDGKLIVTNTPAPYLEVLSGAVKGEFTATYLTDKGCQECYDPAMHVQALAGLAMKPTQEKFVDRADAEGRRLIDQYKIKSTPTILLAGDLGEYPRFAQIWGTVGTVESDGTHVFRAGQPLMGNYHDLQTGKVVKPEPPKAEAPASPANN